MEITYDISEIEEVAKNVVKQLHSVVLFYGNLGTGKTTFIKELIKIQGGEEETSSPTFSLVNEYETTKGIIYHLDLYRINSEAEALDLGLEDYLYGGNTCYIEWPEVIEDLVPEEFSTITIVAKTDTERSLKILNISKRSS